MPFEPPSDGIARHPKSTIKMAKKPNKPFRLTPKLLIRAVLLICITAIGALAVGIVSTFNPNGDKTLQTEPQHTDSPAKPNSGCQTAPSDKMPPNPNTTTPPHPNPHSRTAQKKAAADCRPLPHPRKTGSNRALGCGPGSRFVNRHRNTS